MKSLAVASWNINSVRLREELVLRFLKLACPDIMCLQETKCIDEKLPLENFEKLGYRFAAFRGEKSYNGVLILSKRKIVKIEKFNFCGKDDARHIGIELEDGVKIHNLYIPAGGDLPDTKLNPKFEHKINFLSEIKNKFFKGKKKKTILVGDFNIAPLPDDVWSHKALLNVVSHTKIETDLLSEIKKSGNWIDTFREMKPSGKLYSWWSYRARDWKISNRGRRLDHICAIQDLKFKPVILLSFSYVSNIKSNIPDLENFRCKNLIERCFLAIWNGVSKTIK